LLNPDGSPQLDNKGHPIATYDQTQIQNMARVFTGWTFPTIPGQTPHSHNPAYYVGPMIPVENNHDTNAKTVLGQAIPAGQTAEQDLDQVMGIVFNHPNVGPFVALRLIQHLVTSNPESGVCAAHFGRVREQWFGRARRSRGSRERDSA
jgi:uncharacterized protein (DUF1800 family)